MTSPPRTPHRRKAASLAFALASPHDLPGHDVGDTSGYHSRLAYAETHDDEKGTTAAGVLIHAAKFFAQNGVPRIEHVLSDNALAYRKSVAFKDAVAQIGAEQRFIKPHCPWTSGKVQRLNRTLATEWAYRQIFTSNQARHDALAPWLNYYNTERIHTGIGATPISRVSPRS